MGADWTVAVATWLTERPRRLVPLAALGVLLRDVPRPRRHDAAAVVLAALDQLDAAGLIRFAHLVPTPMVGVLDRDGLRRIAEVPASAIPQKVVEPLPAWRPRR